jgi:acyl-CoA synthetase (AMP-forming)/AMP-acid ligase II
VKSRTLLEAFEDHVARAPAKAAFVFLGKGADETDRLTYAGLRERALAIAELLRQSGVEDGPVLLVFPPGLDFVVALLGCFYAGAIAVPVPFLATRRARERIGPIARDCQPKAALSVAEIVGNRSGWPELANLIWIATDSDGAFRPEVKSSLPHAADIALIQYSSGSTAAPKGVVISHGNLAHNQQLMTEVFDLHAESVAVNWVPPYHDMGLIGAVLQPLYCGMTSVLLPPLNVLQRPILWLQAIGRYRGNTSTAPTFAYELCLRAIPPEQRCTLDLRCWNLAICGAEPVSAEVLEEFAAGFAAAGFAPNAFIPAYGLAEATLLATSARKGEELRIRAVDPVQLGLGKVVPAKAAPCRRLVSCGTAHLGQQVAIVDPQTRHPLHAGSIGEIWLAGESVAQGYWQQPEATQETFHGQLTDGGEGDYLRTGDLGFICEEGLFVTGRLKELLIVRGCNYYPQDLEDAVRLSHPALTKGQGAAFGIEAVAGSESVVVAFELSRGDYENTTSQTTTRAAEAAIAAVSRGFGLQLHDFVLVRPGGLPRTTSGKLQRGRCRALYLAGLLQTPDGVSNVAGRGRWRSPTTREEIGENLT